MTRTELATVAHIDGLRNTDDFTRHVRITRNAHGGYVVVTQTIGQGYASGEPLGLDRHGLIALRDALTAEIDATANPHF